MKTLIAAITTIALSLFAAPAALAQGSGLVAAYGFEEATGTAVTDSAGGLNPGTISGATRSASGRFGSALSFDGVNDRVNVNDSASLDLTAGMTLEAWVRPDAGGWRTAIMKERPGGIAYSLYESTDTNRPSAEIQAETRGTAALPAAAWSHLATTYDGATLRLYVNGTQVSSRAVTGPITISSGALRIGGNAVWGEYFKGLIDEVRIYSRALTAGEIQTDMGRAVALDTQAPTAPVLSGTVNGDDVHLSWTASTDNVGVKEYRIQRDGSLIATLSPTTLAYDDLDRPEGIATYTVRAVDAAGNSVGSNALGLTVVPVGPDTTPPTLKVSGLGGPTTDNICPATAVDDYVPLRVQWGDNRGPVTLHMEVDGATVKGPITDAVGGTTDWDFETAYIPNGPHTTRVVARDGAGNETVRECTWNVQNPDYQVPITAPADGATVSGVVTITAAPTANGNPVSYIVDLLGAPGAAKTGTNEWTWDTTGLTDGEYTLTANLIVPSYEPPLFPPRATDTIHVTLDNTPDDHAPTVSLTACGGDTYDYPLVSGTWSDDHGPVTVRVEVDGETVFGPLTRTGTSSGFNFNWDTRAGANGSHTMRAIARDDAGNETVSDVCTWNVQNKALSVPITSLQDGQTVSGTVHVTAEPRADGDPLTYRPVSVSLTGVPGVTRVGQYDWTWDTTQAGNGDQALTATLFFLDTGGPRASSTIHVNVDNSVPKPTGLTAAVTSTGRDVELHWNWVDGIYDYNIYRDGLKVGHTSANYADDSDVPSGTHTYTVKAVRGPNESAPSDGATVTINRPPAAPVLSGTVAGGAAHLSWTAATDDLGLEEYRVYRNTTLLATTTAGTLTLDDPDLADGTYGYRVIAVDDGGLTASSNEVTLTVTSDTTPPVITLQAGCDGRKLNEYIGPIRGTATDDSGGPVTVTVDVENVHVFGPQAVSEDFQFYWDTRKNANGAVVMKVKARDAAGNETVKDCPWTVDNATLTVPITGAADSTTVGGTVTLGFRPAANGVLTNAPTELFVDGVRKASSGATGPWTYDWDTTTVANGLHTIRADLVFWQGYTQVMATSTIQVRVDNPTAPVGLVAAYGFEETSGTTVTDSSGKGSAGTISGAASVTGGKFGRALSFDGVNDLVTVPDSNALDLTPGMTLEAWVKPTTVADWRTVLLKERPGSLSYALYAATDNGRPQTEIAAAAQREARGPSAITAGSWTHLAATYDGTAVKLYVNGTQVASGTTSGSLLHSTGALRIGGNTIWGEWFSGLIDEVRVYERALTAAEIAADRDRPVVAGS